MNSNAILINAGSHDRPEQKFGPVSIIRPTKPPNAAMGAMHGLIDTACHPAYAKDGKSTVSSNCLLTWPKKQTTLAANSD